ncbi:MAG: DUF481 domain-containing protein [Rubrivivax sp.]|nr:DUF481 domain-containing protein [Rubrivivax sp.]
MKLISAALPAALILVLAGAGRAQAEDTVKTDGRWRGSLGLGASLSSGNTDASSISLTGDAVRATEQDRTSLYLNGQYASSEGEATSENTRLGGRYDWNLGPDYFAFGSLGLENNRFSNVKLRGQVAVGPGWHVIQSPRTTFDVFAGFSYTAESYYDPMFIDGQLRESYNYPGLMLGEESSHTLTENTDFRQRLTVVPNLSNTGEYRANWNAGLAVAMNETLNLTVGFTYAYNSEPGPKRETTDTTLTAGIAVKFE